MSRILRFELNEPTTIALQTLQSIDVINDFGKPQTLFMLVGGNRLYASPELALKIRGLDLKPLESFVIRKYKKGRNVFYDVFLSHGAEMDRAEADLRAIALALQALRAVETELREPLRSAPRQGDRRHGDSENAEERVSEWMTNL